MKRTREEVLGFDDKWMMIFGIPFVALMVNAILFGKMASVSPTQYFGGCQFVALFYTATFWVVFRELHYRFIQKFENVLKPATRYVIMVPAILIVYILLKIFFDLTLDKVFFDKIAQEFKPNAVVEVISSLLFLSLVITVYESIYFSKMAKRLSVEKEQLQKENIKSQLEGLKNQVNPHFLFNSLNTLSYIIPEDSDRAVSFVQKLSRVYRYILEIRNKELIPLKEEMEYLDSYTYLINERFGENINVDLRVEEVHMNDLIIPLSLQILFENAIKHNVISKTKPLNIEVFVNKEHKLVVKNNLQLKSQVMSSTKVGLENIKNRYSFFTNLSVDIIQTDESFIVLIPLIDKHNISDS